MTSLFVAYHNTSSLLAAWDPNQPFDNPVDKWEQRLKHVRDYIPDDVTQLGYVADWNLPSASPDLPNQDTEYVLTQYVLAPYMVTPGLDHEWIIGNFSNPEFESWLDQSLPAYEIQSFGFGIYLIHRTEP